MFFHWLLLCRGYLISIAYWLFSFFQYSTQLKMKWIVLINVKMPTIVHKGLKQGIILRCCLFLTTDRVKIIWLINILCWITGKHNIHDNTHNTSFYMQTLLMNLTQGTKIFQYCTCPAGRVTYNFHSSCKHMYLSFKSVCNKQHKGEIWLPWVFLPKALVLQDKCFGKNYSSF